jgi:D-arginine dehydrogenase
VTRYDVVVVGAGMAGASLAAEVAPHASVLILEMESRPGYHSTGRSAAFWSETYGGPLVQPLTSASRDFLAQGFLSPRGAIHLAGPGGGSALDRLLLDFRDSAVALEPLGSTALSGMLPGLRPGFARALHEPSCADIDVAALHAFYLKQARQAGASLLTDVELLTARRQDGCWRVETRGGAFACGMLVNAAGAWADEVARRAGAAPVGIRPYRRTMVQLRVSPAPPATMPLVIDAEELFYFKPEAGGRLWLSPHDETACAAGDCAAEELDVALAIDRLQRVVDWKVERVEHAWAGLRSFAPDRLPVYGYAEEGFFWCAGQGGFGIQTAPAAAKLAAALLLKREALSKTETIMVDAYSPRRFASTSSS